MMNASVSTIWCQYTLAAPTADVPGGHGSRKQLRIWYKVVRDASLTMGAEEAISAADRLAGGIAWRPRVPLPVTKPKSPRVSQFLLHRTFCMHTHFPIGKSGLDRNAPFVTLIYKHDRSAAHTTGPAAAYCYGARIRAFCHLREGRPCLNGLVRSFES